WKTFVNINSSYNSKPLKFRSRLYASSNQKGSDYNIVFANLELEPRAGSIGFPVEGSFTTLGGDFYSASLRAGLNLRTDLGTPGISAGIQDYRSEPFSFENRDGNFAQLSYSYEYFREKLYLGMDAYARFTDTKGKNWDSTSVSTRFFANYALNKRLSTGMSFEFIGTNFLNKNEVFDKKRRDALFIASPFVNFGIHKNLDLLLSYAFLRNLSSINFYSYTRNLYTLQLVGKF
ncbi:MAG: hypothetical protein NZL90_00880, partial [Aquificaceae bacterium]|nr:hypothetical protein [Aquificaceae bacterium]